MVNKRVLTAYQKSIKLALLNGLPDTAYRWALAMQDLKEGYKKS